MNYSDLTYKYDMNAEIAQEIKERILYTRTLVHEAGHVITSLEYDRYVAVDSKSLPP